MTDGELVKLASMGFQGFFVHKAKEGDSRSLQTGVGICYGNLSYGIKGQYCRIDLGLSYSLRCLVLLGEKRELIQPFRLDAFNPNSALSEL